jgi:hypothetical protein
LRCPLGRPVAFWPVRVGVGLVEKPGLVGTQTLMFLSADIEGSAAMVQRLGNARSGVLADCGRLISRG